MDALFTIVIPVYNRKHLVERTLRSVERQTYRPIHLVLVDNNSTDGSLQFLREYARNNARDGLSVSVLEEKRQGAAAARNRGLEAVESKYMLFFDSDDELRPEAVEAYMRAFSAETDVELVVSRSLYHGVNADSLRKPRRGDMLINHIHHSTLYTLGYAARTSLFRRVGGWNPDLLIWDDWELGIRLLLDVHKIKIVNYIANDIYCTGNSISGDLYSHRAECYEAAISAAERVLASSSRSDGERLASMMNYRRMMLAAHFAKEGRMDLASPLKGDVLSATIGVRRRMLLLLAYNYIRRGGRGFDRVINCFY